MNEETVLFPSIQSIVRSITIDGCGFIKASRQHRNAHRQIRARVVLPRLGLRCRITSPAGCSAERKRKSADPLDRRSKTNRDASSRRDQSMNMPGSEIPSSMDSTVMSGPRWTMVGM